jgi:hypothetical protein
MWSKPCSTLDLDLHLGLALDEALIDDVPAVFIQDALYFMLTYEYYDAYDAAADDDCNEGMAILKYDIGSNCLSLIDAPPLESPPSDGAILMSMEDGGLGFAYLDGFTLRLWSTQMRSSRFPPWTQRIVVNLNGVLPIQNIRKTLSLTGSVERANIIFVIMDLDIYEINLKSSQWKKLWKGKKYHTLFPYMSFYNTRGIFIYILSFQTWSIFFCHLGQWNEQKYEMYN